jgi:hypothetical protein
MWVVFVDKSNRCPQALFGEVPEHSRGIEMMAID